MGFQGIDSCHIDQGRMNAANYLKVLDDNLLSCVIQSKERKENLVFQQDNPPCHTAKQENQENSESGKYDCLRVASQEPRPFPN